MENKLQMIGGGLILVALLFLFFIDRVTWFWIPGWIVMATVLGIDLWLVYKKQNTITQWFRPKLPKWVDFILTIGVVSLFVWAHGGIVGLYILMGTINGHLNGDW